MDRVSSTGFWSVIGIISAAIGGLFLLNMTHASTPKHPEAAHESDVYDVNIRFERVATQVAHNSTILEEVKLDIKELRVEQTESSMRILNAIGERDE